MKPIFLVWLAALAVACANPFARGPALEPALWELTPVANPPLTDLQQRAEIFYDRISNRRFNSIATYQDPGLREFFVSRESFADYFANFVQTLTDGHFERHRVTRVRIEEVRSSEPDHAWVIVRFWGGNSQPLRWWSVDLVRVDQWEYADGRWWIIPGKL